MSSRDTRRSARECQKAALLRLGGAARVELAFEMSGQAREISLQGVRRRQPALSREDAERLLLRRLLGEELYAAAYERPGDRATSRESSS